jgi:cyclase
VELAARYAGEGADEIVFLDIGASPQQRPTLFELVRATAAQVFVPLTVGGGIRDPEDMKQALRAGADKVAVNTAAVRNPALLTECARRFGRQCVVLAIDARRHYRGHEVVIVGGREPTGLDALGWARLGARMGAGELLLTSVDGDGTQAGYDLGLIAAVAAAVEVPIIASGGAGSVGHFVEAAEAGASGVLAASLFHQGRISINQVKQAMAAAGIPVRAG